MVKYFPNLKNVNVANAITSLGIILGFVSLALVLKQELRPALTLYMVCLIIDRVDGYVARRLDQASAFGAQLDGLADTINFCLYPAAVAYALGFDSWLMVAVLCVFLVCAVWRIAYFNVTGLQNEAGDSYFVGLPTPFVGACFLILASFSGLIPAKYLIPLMFVFFIFMSLLMSLSFLYAKNGILTTGISILAPIAILFMWLYQ